MDKLKQIQKQMEYYLGDANLKNDKFFYDLIIQEQSREIPVDVFSNARKSPNSKLPQRRSWRPAKTLISCKRI